VINRITERIAADYHCGRSCTVHIYPADGVSHEQDHPGKNERCDCEQNFLPLFQMPRPTDAADKRQKNPCGRSERKDIEVTRNKVKPELGGNVEVTGPNSYEDKTNSSSNCVSPTRAGVH